MNVSSVVNRKKCMSCGYCETICPQNAIQMEYISKQGLYRPHINEKLCIECGLCKKRCPAENQVNDSIMGDYQAIYLAHSTDNSVRHEATSGGCIHALVDFMLDKGLVDGVLMAGYDSLSEIETSVYFITADNRNEFQALPRNFASRYVSIPTLAKLKEYKKFNKIAVVGTPCQILALTCGGHKGFDIFKIGVTCSGGMSYKATEQYKRIQSMEGSKMFYRGNGWPGTNCLILGEKMLEHPHPGSLFERMFSSQIFKNPGCRYCTDHFAEKADVSFCDFWNKVELANESEGNSCVILRSNRAKQYFDMSVAEGYIETVRELREDQVISTQLHVLQNKKSDIRNSKKYKIFMRICDFVFSTHLYKIFKIQVYQKFCSWYGKICSDAKIDSELHCKNTTSQ